MVCGGTVPCFQYRLFAAVLAQGLCTVICMCVGRQADRFHKTGRQLRSKMWWQNMKMKLIIAAIVLVLALIIFLMACFSGGNCLKH